MNCHPNLFVITGGPGSGKTTLLEELQRRGFRYIPEVAREIICEQMASGGNALPWADTEKYIRLMLSRSVAGFLANTGSKQPFFSDRGIPDTLAYARLIKSDILEEAEQFARKYRYHPMVFILPPWDEIYCTDTERKQTHEEAMATFQMIQETYKQLNYNLTEVPRLSVSDRACFIQQALSALNEPKIP